MKSFISISKIVFVILFAFVFFGCTHTNNLAKFNVSSSKILFKKYISPDLANVNVNFNTGYGFDTKSIVTVVLGGLGSAYTEGQVREKFQKAINGDSLVTNISEGVRDGLLTYYKIIPVTALEEDPKFIVESRLQKFTLESNSYGIHARVKTKVIITDRNTAKTVWENDETSSVPLYDVLINSFGNETIQTTKSIINAIRLMNMTEQELRIAINNAAEDAGKKQSETLREDIAGE